MLALNRATTAFIRRPLCRHNIAHNRIDLPLILENKAQIMDE